MTRHNGSALEWRDPNEFVIFFNTWRGIRDQRYTMTHYSNNALWVRLSNVTVHDEGVYTCVSYGSTSRTKQVNVTVLAAPAKLLLDVSPVRADNQDERTVLRCSTWGSKPPPQITWLLDSGLELFGVTDNHLEGKKFNSASILSVHTYTQKSSISCVIRHKALGEEKLTTTLYPKALGPNKIFNVTKGPTAVRTPSSNAYIQTLNSQTTDGKLTQLNIHCLFILYTPKTPTVLLPVLVAVLLFALFIVVLLLVTKLWKAHQEWKKENEVSEQTLESNRPKPNDDNFWQEKNGHDPVHVMNGERPSRNGLLEPHVHYSFLKTASEGLSQDESDSESLAREMEYQSELQKRINKTEKMVDQSFEEEDSLEEDSLEGKYYFSGEESDADETHIPNGTSLGKENCKNASNQEEVADKYAALRYDPTWKNDPERKSFVGSDESCQDYAEQSPALSLNSIYNPSQFSLTFRSRRQQECPQDAPHVFDREFLNSCDPVGKVSHGACGAQNKEEQTNCHFDSSPRTNSDMYSPHIREYKKKSGTDFVEKNKMTLGLTSGKNLSYFQLHSKKQRGDHQGEAHLHKEHEIGGTNSSQATSLEENVSKMSNQSPLGTQAELRSLKDRCHNVLELENTRASSNSYREGADGEQESRHSLHHPLSPNPSVTPLHPSIEHSCTCSWVHQFPTGSGCSVHPNAKQQLMTVTFGENLIELNPYPNLSGLHLPCAGETKKKNQRHIESTCGPCHQPPFRCTVSEPLSTTRHGKHQVLKGCNSFSPVSKAGFPPPVDGNVSSGIPRRIYREISHSHVSGNSGPSQPPACRLIQACSPTTRLIRAAEERHLEMSQLANDYLSGSRLAGMFPPIMQRGESDSRINRESHEGSQPVLLSHSNSEGCLLQAKKEKKEKEKRQSYRTKGYVNMDVKLGGLGPDYEAVKEKSEKIKQQKEYAKHVQEHNMKSNTNARKPPPRPECKSGASRQKVR
ncbi:hypothetical protein JRQ81_010741 [Phrynocephalus forsythii]|uniref:Ig-like domain-containing protein n=1 Tax=Phrynocephalus forsythii TaxID=171643 RepID=A0A9Q0X935_9SAUR|nr:hypothetical protein JRQ81_010741 [Phrynocephalus forsythii]